MTIQVLITTMNLNNPEELLNRLNIQSSFVIGNQNNSDSTECFKYHGNNGLIISRNEKGVGRNRNITLEYSDSDLCILSDDDMSFVDGYLDIVENTFKRLPDADVIIFNLGNSGNERRSNKKTKRLNKFNYMNYGAARVAFKRKVISYSGISFNCNFGGGTQHCAGEDVLFIGDCLKAGLRIYAVPETIASLLDVRESTWFKGYDKKYLFDKGVFLCVSDKNLARLYAAYLALKHPEYKDNNKNTLDVYKKICEGIRYIKRKEYLQNENKIKDWY